MNKKKDFILFHEPSIGKEEENEILDSLRSGWITKGPKTKRFEELFADYCNVKYAIGVNSCTSGLHLALSTLGIKEGDEVITTPISWPATVNVIFQTGAEPIFVDVEKDTLNIDSKKIKKAITKKTKAIIPVHFAGQPCEMDEIIKISQDYNLKIVEDAAHAIEAIYKNEKIGSIGDFTSFSFYPTKNITTGEGGMLTTNNKDLEEKARILSCHGISKDAWKRYSEEGYKHWEYLLPGYKYHMSDLQAALGIPQLKKIEQFWEKRRKLTKRYNKFLDSLEEISIIGKEKGSCKNSYHLYPIIIKTEILKVNRDYIMNEIQAENIGVGVHFRALHLQKVFSKRGFHRGMFPNAEYASDRLISLPLYPKLECKDIEYISNTIKKIIKRHKK